MSRYKDSINALYNAQSVKFSKTVCNYIYSKLYIQVDELIINFEGQNYIKYNGNWKEMSIDMTVEKDTLLNIVIQSDGVPELKETFTIPRNDKINDAFNDLILSLHITDMTVNHLSLESMYNSLLPDANTTDEVVIHDTIRSVVDNANASKDGWFKTRQISEGINTVDTCLLINPNWGSGYTGHVLPLSWYFLLDVPVVKVIKIRPVLLQAWYPVESGQKEHVLNIIDEGE